MRSLEDTGKDLKKMKKNIINNIKDFSKRNYLILMIYLASTGFYLYQYMTYFSWDFLTYSMNARYWVAGGFYFEPFRPPLASLIIGLIAIISTWKIAEVFLIIFTSSIFLYSIIRLSRVLRFDSSLLYLASFTPYILFYGTRNGTELLSAAFLLLSICFIIEGSPLSGFILGLSALSRYTALGLFFLLLFHLEKKKIAKSFALFILTLAPWFIYNFVKYGNFFTSIADQYANNILFRDYLRQPIVINDFFITQSIHLPFLIIGIFLSFYGIIRLISKKKKSRHDIMRFIKEKKIDLIMLVLLLFSIYSYVNIPVKNVRYLFLIIIPSIYYSYLGIVWIIDKISSQRRFNLNKVIVSFVVILFLFSWVAAEVIRNGQPESYSQSFYEEAQNKIKDHGLDHCTISSNYWVFFNYIGQKSIPFGRKETIDERLKKREVLYIFRQDPDFHYFNNKTFTSRLPVIYEDDDWILIGNDRCRVTSRFDKTYLQHTDEAVFFLKGKHINTNPCFILFQDIGILEKTCNFINLNSFKKDDLREKG